MTSSRLLIPATVRLGGFSGLADPPITAAGMAVFALKPEPLMPEPLRPPAGPGSLLAVVAFSTRWSGRSIWYSLKDVPFAW
ncbi:MAG TPA: hypothetical protein VMU94_04295 [Streptosporangiaceae bacterium]|nr:hypothetical protein [Streptosporangiaceae bacterium]